MPKVLRSGYSTGTHATAILGALLHEEYKDVLFENIELTLPTSQIANIKVKHETKRHFSTIKVDNDDIDVTKGCCINAKFFNERPTVLKEIDQIPSILDVYNGKIYVYAGAGVGVVSKKGLKIEPNYPAINPIPLSMMKSISLNVLNKNFSDDIHVVFSVDNGEEIAKSTANSKVGVLGGISILGTRGIVKPISAGAYIDSIETEIDVISASKSDEIIFTLGNTAHDYAIKTYGEERVVEIGNFIYDASALLKEKKIKKLIFISSIAKMTKVAQGFKNSHNKYGFIDFDALRELITDETGIDLANEEFLTVKAIVQSLNKNEVEEFINMINQKAGKKFIDYFQELDIDIKELEIVTLESNEVYKRGLSW